MVFSRKDDSYIGGIGSERVDDEQPKSDFECLLARHQDVIEAEVARTRRENEIKGLEREDLLQTCAIAAWNAWPKLNAAAEPRVYMRKICCSALNRHIKRTSRDLLARAVSLVADLTAWFSANERWPHRRVHELSEQKHTSAGHSIRIPTWRLSLRHTAP